MEQCHHYLPVPTCACPSSLPRQVLTPVRRSARKIEGGGSRAAAGPEALLEVTNYSYTPNRALGAEGQADSS